MRAVFKTRIFLALFRAFLALGPTVEHITAPASSVASTYVWQFCYGGSLFLRGYNKAINYDHHPADSLGRSGGPARLRTSWRPRHRDHGGELRDNARHIL